MKRLVFAIATICMAGCSETGVAPRQTSLTTESLTFLRFDSAAYSAAQKAGSFWAVKGQDRSIALRYADSGTGFMQFDVPSDALATRPDGTAIQPGDSVLISVSVDNTGHFIFNFQPSGLKFSDSAPAHLTVDYTRANADVNGDGVVNLTDTLLSAQAAVWQQELPGLPWLKIPTLTLTTSVAQADIHGFTEFGMAVN